MQKQNSNFSADSLDYGTIFKKITSGSTLLFLTNNYTVDHAHGVVWQMQVIILDKFSLDILSLKALVQLYR